ncbi:MAG TPA: hypothetical protein VFS05_14385 [Gemmatimonadaceae bacterium]|nr:hypothetical protein [Gemmatimonadaceae bacterium]
MLAPFIRSARAAVLATLLLLLALPLGAARAGAQDDPGDPPYPSALRVTAQVGAGIIGTPVGFVAGGLTTRWVARRLGAGEESASRVAYVGAWTGSALVTALGPTLIGSAGRVKGSYPAAVGGAVAGGLASWLLVKLNDRGAEEPDRPCHLGCIVAGAAVFALPGIGATVAFNATREFER